MELLQALSICPSCSARDLSWTSDAVTCLRCGSAFQREGRYVDFVERSRLQGLEAKALEVWGDDLHSTDLAAPSHFGQVQALFPGAWKSSIHGNVLEMGCGSGTDAARLSEMHCSTTFLAFDLGRNAAGLSRKFADRRNLAFFRANALRVPIADDSVDMIYSFGVFHHTRDPRKCFEEARRTLKENGAIFFYLYSAHEDNPGKFFGIQMEKALMGVLGLAPKSLHPSLLFAVSLPCLALFSWPARLLNAFGLERFARKLPMHWGTTPASILPDLKDRLLAPVNHRFTRKDLEALLRDVAFRRIELRKTSSGVFGYCVK